MSLCAELLLDTKTYVVSLRSGGEEEEGEGLLTVPKTFVFPAHSSTKTGFAQLTVWSGRPQEACTLDLSSTPDIGGLPWSSSGRHSGAVRPTTVETMF